MKKLSITKMADTIITRRKAQKLTQAQLAEMTNINRGMISRLESLDYTPSIDQLQAIAEVLGFEVVDLFEDDKPAVNKPVLDRRYNIAVAGTGYVGLSIATLLSQHNHVTAVDIIPEKVDLINNRKSPIQDDYIEKYLAEAVYTTGMVDLMIMVAAGLTFNTSSITASTAEQSKKFFLLS